MKSLSLLMLLAVVALALIGKVQARADADAELESQALLEATAEVDAEAQPSILSDPTNVVKLASLQSQQFIAEMKAKKYDTSLNLTPFLKRTNRRLQAIIAKVDKSAEKLAAENAKLKHPKIKSMLRLKAKRTLAARLRKMIRKTTKAINYIDSKSFKPRGVLEYGVVLGKSKQIRNNDQYNAHSQNPHKITNPSFVELEMPEKELLNTVDTIMKIGVPAYTGGIPVDQYGRLCKSCDPIVYNHDSPLSIYDHKILRNTHEKIPIPHDTPLLGEDTLDDARFQVEEANFLRRKIISKYPPKH